MLAKDRSWPRGARFAYKLQLTVVLIGLVLSGVSVALARPLPPISATDRAARLALLEQRPNLGAPEEELRNETLSCEEYSVLLPVFDPKSKVVGKRLLSVYLPRNTSKPVPAVLVIPSILGEQITDDWAADSLCDGGIAAVVADFFDTSDVKTIPGWEVFNDRVVYAVQALRTTVDYISAHPRIDHAHIGALGFSLGAILSGFLAGVEPRISATVIVGGAGNLPAVLAHTTESQLTELREKRMEYMKTNSVDDYEDALRQSMSVDPLHFVQTTQAASVHMVIIKDDTTVPYINQLELWHALGKPSFEEKDLSHIMSIIQVAMFEMDSIVDFFRKRFN